jgi:hypothetical protein
MGRYSATDFIKSYDEYPTPITLKYNKAGSLSSVPGGILAITVDLILLWWFINIIKENWSDKLNESLTQNIDFGTVDSGSAVADGKYSFENNITT